MLLYKVPRGTGADTYAWADAMTESDEGQAGEKPAALLETLYYMSPQNDSGRPRKRDFIPFAAILLVAAFDVVLYEFPSASPPSGLFGAVIVTFVVPSVVLLGASFYAMGTKPRASITLIIGGLLSAGAFFVHLVLIVILAIKPPG